MDITAAPKQSFIKLNLLQVKDTYVVAIGYSAGGLEPITRFLDHTRLDNTAYIILRHIGSNHQGKLHSILQKHSKLTLKEVTHGEVIAKNVVYIHPPSSYITIQNNKLLLDDRPTLGLNNIIDHFFTSLADDKKEYSFGILLSGMGKDGTEGTCAIKMNGGTVIVQEPSTCECPSMPLNAIRTNMVDYIVPVEQMQDIIRSIIKNRSGTVD